MKTIELVDASQPLSHYARNAIDETVVVTDHGKPVAALVPIENADLETVSLSTNPQFMAIIERSRARMAKEGGIPLKEVKRRLLGKRK
jgi:prevent-host-death family protein